MPIEIVSDTKDMIVVNKPPSIPVHPTGRYTHNSLINILRHEMGINAVHPINRIDRLTSGLVLIAKNRFTAQEKSKEMQSRNISKTYLCRVRGDFPEYVLFVVLCCRKRLLTKRNRGEIVCEEPLAVFAHKLGINHVNANGKESKTIFKKLSFNGRTSVVEAKPLTGRTHQIRVHLQFLGYPIANDPLYASDLWGPDGGKGNLDQERLASITAQLSKRLAQDPKEDEETEAEVVFCLDCAQSRSDPDPDLMSIWLHSVRYEGESWSYETALPCWASEDFDGDQRVMDKGHLVIQLD